MRVVFAVLLLSAVATSQTISVATETAYNNARQTCLQTIGTALQGQAQDCQTLSASLGSVFTNPNASLAPLCTSSCFATIRNAMAAFGGCMIAYKPTLVANLQKDGVADPTTAAQQKLQIDTKLADYFDFLCLKNEREEYCFPKLTQLGTDLANRTYNGTSVYDAVCGGFYNMGCCLTSLGKTFDLSATSNVSFYTSLATVCPVLANYNPPLCPGFGQRFMTLSVSMALTGLSCDTYMQQPETLKAEYMAALKLDLVHYGFSADYVTISTITNAAGVCTVNVVLRGTNDQVTSGLNAQASTMNTASLTNSNEILATASLGSATLGSATVSTTYMTGQAGANSGALVAPSMALLAAFFVWLA